uniref:Glyoxysomal processing protease, glyoxysomal n=2 Tax=Glycine max TaxID=3847 RepID=A0A0R0FXN2_SOYBN
MIPSETVNFARNFAAMVRVRGPVSFSFSLLQRRLLYYHRSLSLQLTFRDPKGLKMRKHAFHQYCSGGTTLSASGMLVPDTLCDAQVAGCLYGDNCEDRVLVVTVASVVEPFLSPQQRDNIPQGRPDLISGVRIDVMTEEANEKSNQGTPCWLAAELLSLVDIPASSNCLQSLIEASLGLPEHEWEERLGVGVSGSASLMYKSLTRMAIFSVSLSFRDLLDSKVSAMNKKGDFLLAVGSPFGVLSPMHFFNSISVGCIANCYPPHSSDGSLLMADIRCLPGMEGSPVFSEHACLIGVLIRPLRQKTYGEEIQLVIPWDAIVTASSSLLRKRPQNTQKGLCNQGKLLCCRKGFFPSVCSGVVAKVVEAKTPQSYLSIQPEHLHNHEHFPAMLETTATIHPGASGGAVINSDGHMIGLVTSNARHSGGAVIPHLNFSIPSAALAPVFKFSKAMQDLSLLRILDEPNEYLSSVWALMRPSYPNPHPMHDPPQSVTDNKNKEKGSRFAKVYC